MISDAALLLATAPPPLLALPFVLLLSALAVMPFVDPHWWERHYAKVSVALGVICSAGYLWWSGNYGRLLRTGHEYLGFMALVGSLYVIAGGIHLRVRGQATPLANCTLLGLGAVLSNVVGTTGASMLLIRPYLHMNRRRIKGFHVVFFIFLVSNVGGCLTPVGDPPLFVGFLKGVPFWWVLFHCWQAGALVAGALLVVFYWRDRRDFLLAPPPVQKPGAYEETWRFDGLSNLLFLAVVFGAVFLERPTGLRETLMAAAALGSFYTTPRRVHQANGFHFGPILEVGWVFVGIFATMAPVLDYLTAQAPMLGIRSPMQFFWLTGALSAVLDSAPAYLAALATAMGNDGLNVDRAHDLTTFLATRGAELGAISLGAVFFGAATYLGNGPNFMVRAIAEHAGVNMPHFFKYIWRYALPVLGPLFFLVSLLFFSRGRVW